MKQREGVWIRCFPNHFTASRNELRGLLDENRFISTFFDQRNIVDGDESLSQHSNAATMHYAVGKGGFDFEKVRMAAMDFKRTGVPITPVRNAITVLNIAPISGQ